MAKVSAISVLSINIPASSIKGIHNPFHLEKQTLTMTSLLDEMPSFSALLSTYATLSATIMLIRTILCEIIPKQTRDYIFSKLSDSFSHYFSPNFTFIIEERWQAVENETFRSVEAYLPTRIGPSTDSLLIGSNDPQNTEQSIPVDCRIIDEFHGMKLEWRLCCVEAKKYFQRERRYFKLLCKRNDREKVMKTYFPHIAAVAKTILNKRQNLHIYTYDQECCSWESTVFKHPSTFDTLAMEPELKQSILDDLNAFVHRKEFFQGVGRAWKRGYLLYGPPGTGKSSLVAAIANHMRYNIYDLQLQSARSDADLRRILTSTTNRSILLVEDIDCSTKVSRDRSKMEDNEDSDEEEAKRPCSASSDPGVTLSGLLNFIDGLWSSCGDERIIIFTTNHKDKLDSALLRPGRMDVHVYMGPCTPAGFRKLVDSYLGIKEHILFSAIEQLLETVSVTPAEAAQQLMKNDDSQKVLESFVEFLKTKGTENEDEKK